MRVNVYDVKVISSRSDHVRNDDRSMLESRFFVIHVITLLSKLIREWVRGALSSPYTPGDQNPRSWNISYFSEINICYIIW